MREQNEYDIRDYLNDVTHNLRILQERIALEDLYCAEMLGDLIDACKKTEELILEANVR